MIAAALEEEDCSGRGVAAPATSYLSIIVLQLHAATAMQRGVERIEMMSRRGVYLCRGRCWRGGGAILLSDIKKPPARRQNIKNTSCATGCRNMQQMQMPCPTLAQLGIYSPRKNHHRPPHQQYPSQVTHQLSL